MQRISPLRLSAISLSLVAGLALVSCGTGDATSNGKGSPNEAAAEEADLVAGGEVTQIVSFDMITLDPARMTTNNPNLLASYFNLIYGNLLTRDVETGEVSGGFAESMEPNEDGTVWTLSLKPGIFFTDGTSMDAEAIKANWDRLADPEVAAFSGDFARSLTTEVIDEKTLEISVEEPNFYLDGEIATQMNYIVSPTAIEENPDVFTTDPVGAGPYVLGESVPDSHHVFEINEDYFETEKPYIEKVTLQVQGDRQQQVDTLLAGGADAAMPNSWDVVEMIGDGLAVPDLQAGGARLIVFNTASSPFDDPRARRALAIATDGDELAQIHDAGSGSAAATSLFAETNPYYSEDRLLPTQDQTEAQELFDEIAAEGEPLSFKLTTAGPGGTRAAEWLQQQLEDYENVSVELDVIPIPNFEEQVTVRDDFHVAIRPGVTQIKDPAPGLTSLLRTGGSQNVANYSSEEMDQALADLLATSDEAEREDLLDRVHEIYLDDMPYYAFGNSVLGTMHDSELKNIRPVEEGAILWENASW